ncbi:MAG: hypothetical protein IKP86_02615 [Anaerolineaceae bacterium]|nr:hypothetical protein [Anaerolineaceae bacterium]
MNSLGNAGSDIRRLKRLNLTDEEKQMILGGNSAGIYQIEKTDRKKTRMGVIR